MLKLSRLTDYAVVVMVQLAQDGAGEPNCQELAGVEVQTSPRIAQSTGIPEPTVAKVLKALAAGGLVASQRGARGGYRLARPLGAVPIADVIAAIDGPIALTACVDGGPGTCEAMHYCRMRGRWDRVNDAIYAALTNITLADMAETPFGAFDQQPRRDPGPAPAPGHAPGRAPGGHVPAGHAPGHAPGQPTASFSIQAAE